MRQPRGLEVGERLGPAGGRVDGPAGGGEALGGRAADAGRAARDERRAGDGRIGHGTETIGSHGRPAASRPALGHRRGLPRARRSRTRTCTSARSRCSRARRRSSTSSSRTSSRACTSCRATGRSSPTPPLETGRPLWIDDPTFNLAYHVRHTALPAPGDEDALLDLGARIFSQRAGPLEAAVGAVARRGARGRRLRADLEDPPRARRRRLRRRPLDRAVRPRRPRRRPDGARRAVGAAARADERRAGRARR